MQCLPKRKPFIKTLLKGFKKLIRKVRGYYIKIIIKIVLVGYLN